MKNRNLHFSFCTLVYFAGAVLVAWIVYSGRP